MSESLPGEPLLRVEVPGARATAYPVYVGCGLLPRLGELIVDLAPAHRHVIVADDEVAGLYGARAVEALASVGLSGELLSFEAGEARKTRDTWVELTDRMLAAGVGRDAVVVALGGGVTGDLAGFVASTYMRGIPLVAVPTSLLAMLDSSIGGKTGVDTPTVKNAVGTFHHPCQVVVDPDLLATLPSPHRRAGLAEAVKIAAMREARSFEWIESHAAALAGGEPGAVEVLVTRCLRLKAGVVVADPRESAERQVLNFGHTAGHALETLAGFELLHGEAVAAGMRLEARMGEAVGMTEEGTAARLDAVLAACDVPDVLSSSSSVVVRDRFEDGLTGARIVEAAASDKKARRGRVRWVFPARIGEAAREAGGDWSHAFSESEAAVLLDRALRAIADVRDSAP